MKATEAPGEEWEAISNPSETISDDGPTSSVPVRAPASPASVTVAIKPMPSALPNQDDTGTFVCAARIQRSVKCQALSRERVP